MKNWFTEHPRSVNETYWQHCCFSLSSGVRLFIAALAALVHAIFPFLFVYTVSQLVAKMASIYCQGERRDGFLNKVNGYLDPSEKCCIYKDKQ